MDLTKLSARSKKLDELIWECVKYHNRELILKRDMDELLCKFIDVKACDKELRKALSEHITELQSDKDDNEVSFINAVSAAIIHYKKVTKTYF
jgi:hypothetical protein